MVDGRFHPQRVNRIHARIAHPSMMGGQINYAFVFPTCFIVMADVIDDLITHAQGAGIRKTGGIFNGELGISQPVVCG